MPEHDSSVELPPPRLQSLGKATSRGFTWMSLGLLAGKVCLFLAQVVLGWILTQEDFGVFAVAATLIGIIKIFQDGGVPQVLVQRGEAEFDRLQGAMFWLTMTLSTCAGMLLAVVAPLIAGRYGDSRLTPMLWVLAATLPLGAPANMLRARMQLELKFRQIAVLSSVQFAVRSIGMIVMAVSGFGVMSFVMPLIVVAVVGDLLAYWYTRSRPWRDPVLFHEWPGLIRNSNWIVLATMFKGLARNGDYLVLGLLISQSLLGVYYFAYQLTIQSTVLVALNLRHVLFPVMSKLADQPARQVAAIVKTIRMIILTTAPGSILLAVTIQPLEELIWHKKWAEAVPLVQALAIVSPILIFTDIVHAVLTSRGRFRSSALLTLLEGLWLMASAWLAVQIAGTRNITAIAILIFGLQITYAVAVSGLLLRSHGIRPATFFAAFVPQWATALCAAGVAMAVGLLLPGWIHPLIRIVVLGAVCAVAYGAIAWALLRSDLEELANVAPRIVGNLVRKVFMLRPAGRA